MALANALGASVNLTFAPNDDFDYCVANTVNSGKYLLARVRGVPVVTIGWLRDSVAAGGFLTRDLENIETSRPYRPSPLSGLSVCVTGYNQNERNEIEKDVVVHGGHYSSDLVKGKCTHLVASNTTSSKYAHASKWDGVSIVDKNWLRECITQSCRVDEKEFPVEGSVEARRRSDSLKKQGHSSEATEDFETIAGRAVPWDSCYLLNTRVCLFGFDEETHEAKRVLRIVRHAGAGCVVNPAKATHVVVRQDPPSGSLRPLKEFRDKVVHASWLDACEAEEGVAEEEPHVVAPSLFAAAPAAPGRSTRAETTKRDERTDAKAKAQKNTKAKESVFDRADRSGDAEPSRRGAATPEKVNPLTRAALAQEARAEAAAAAAVPVDKPKHSNVPEDQNKAPNFGHNFSEYPQTGTELPATAFAVPETAAAYTAEGGDKDGGCASATVFAGMKIALSPLLSREEEDAAREFVAAGSGVCVSSAQSSAYDNATYVVCPAAPTAEERRGLLNERSDGRTQVTCHWLEICVSLGCIVSLSSDDDGEVLDGADTNPAYRPLPCNASLPSMQGLRISTSTYDERIKASVHMLCHLLGARYTDRLGRNKNTHLIVPVAEGAKYTAAVGWGLHVVTVEWLKACVAAGKRVDESGFAPPPPVEDEDETEAPGTSGETRELDKDKDDTYVPEKEAENEKDDGDEQRPRGSQRHRGSQRQVGNATARASLSAVLQVSQPPTLAAVPPVAPPTSAPVPSAAPVPKRPNSITRPKPKAKTILTPKVQKSKEQPTRRKTPLPRATALETAAPRAPDPPARNKSATPVRRANSNIPDGSQFAANMIDDVAAQMLGGDVGDPSMDAYGDGFRVPDAVFGKAIPSPSAPSGSQADDDVFLAGVSSGKKRKARPVHSQGDLETQQIVGLVGYADETPKRGGAALKRSGSKPREGNAAGLVTSLIGGKGGNATGVGGAGLRAEDWE